MKAVVLAAGRGSRLRPLTDTLPKPLAVVRGKALIDYSIDGLASSGVSEIAVVIGHLGDKIVTHLEGRKDVNLSFFRQEKVNGTASAVLLCESFLTTDFVMLYGDTYFHGDSVQRIASTAAGGVVGAVRSVAPEKYGCISINAEGSVSGIVEKPEFPLSNLVVMGGYKFPQEIFRHLRTITPSSRGELELPDAVRLSIDSGVRYIVAQIDGSDDVATLQDLDRLNRI